MILVAVGFPWTRRSSRGINLGSGSSLASFLGLWRRTVSVVQSCFAASTGGSSSVRSSNGVTSLLPDLTDEEPLDA